MPEDAKTPIRPGTPGAGATPGEARAEETPSLTPQERAHLAEEASREEDA
jgi:hypothetical protein